MSRMSQDRAFDLLKEMLDAEVYERLTNGGRR